MRNVYEKSIVLVGPVGAGKSLIGRELSKKHNMPVITTDLLRHCPKNINDIEEYKIHLLDELEKADSKDVGRINDIKNEIWVCNERIKLRKLLPNVRNYEEMGFDGNISRYADTQSPIIWHFYQKQFENQLLHDIVEQLEVPAIIDMGGGMAISLDKDYRRLEEKFKRVDEDKFNKVINMDNIGFHLIQSYLEPFKNVVELQLPDNYKEVLAEERAGRDRLNEAFIATGQYHDVSSSHITVSGLVEEGKINQDILEDIVKQISKRLSKDDINVSR